VSSEEPTNELNLRLRATVNHYGIPDHELHTLDVIGNENWGLPLIQDGKIVGINEEGWRELIREIDLSRADVVILDPLINLMGGADINENSAASVLMSNCALVAAQRQIAIAIAHHTSKGRGSGTAESAMGAATFTNLVRVARGIERLTEKELKAEGFPEWEEIYRLGGSKANYSKKGKGRLFRIVGVRLDNAEPPLYPEGDEVGVIEIARPTAVASGYPPRLIQAALLAIANANPPLGPTKQSKSRYAAPVVAAAIAPYRDNGTASDKDAEAVLDFAKRSGWIVDQDVEIARPGKGADVRKGFVLTPRGKAVAQGQQIAPADDGRSNPAEGGQNNQPEPPSPAKIAIDTLATAAVAVAGEDDAAALRATAVQIVNDGVEALRAKGIGQAAGAPTSTPVRASEAEPENDPVAPHPRQRRKRRPPTMPAQSNPEEKN
jgi:AAA domain